MANIGSAIKIGSQFAFVAGADRVIERDFDTIHAVTPGLERDLNQVLMNAHAFRQFREELSVNFFAAEDDDIGGSSPYLYFP